MSDAPNSGNDPDPLEDARLASLRKEVTAAIDKRDVAENLSNKANAGNGSAKNMGVALRMASEFASAIAVGVLLGYGADMTFKTAPWGLVIGLPLGFAAGILNVVRAAQKISAEAPKGHDLPPARDED
jgi:ATP synthase protein I